MERLKTVLARHLHAAFLVFLGLVLIVYIALGVLYLQQAPQRRQLEEQIVKLSAILRTPVPDPQLLQAELDAVDLALTPVAANTTIAMLLEIARQYGIDTSESGGKFKVPIVAYGSSGPYQILSFKGIHVQGETGAVMELINLLDSDEKLTPPGSDSPRTVTRVVTRVAIEDIEVTPPLSSEEGKRRAELRSISQAVKEMIADNRLVRIPNPFSAAKGRAINKMGDDPATLGLLEGFPDNTTTAAQKGYTGNSTPKNGYILFEHDKINSDNTSLFSTTNYTQTLQTVYYYTAEEDGTVRQWSGFNVFSAEEFTDSSPTRMELIAKLDIDFYFRGK